jgi:hypothetical protein
MTIFSPVKHFHWKIIIFNNENESFNNNRKVDTCSVIFFLNNAIYLIFLTLSELQQ